MKEYHKTKYCHTVLNVTILADTGIVLELATLAFLKIKEHPPSFKSYPTTRWKKNHWTDIPSDFDFLSASRHNFERTNAEKYKLLVSGRQGFPQSREDMRTRHCWQFYIDINAIFLFPQTVIEMLTLPHMTSILWSRSDKCTETAFEFHAKAAG
jgi:hypothetical protein